MEKSLSQQKSAIFIRSSQILWASFLIAAAMEMFVFAWVDPNTLTFGNWHPDIRTAYSVTFFVFWFFLAAASFFSLWMTGTVKLPSKQNEEIKESR